MKVPFHPENYMNTKREYNNIQSSFAMEGLQFDDECAKRVLSVLNGKMTVQDAIAEIDAKYEKNCK